MINVMGKFSKTLRALLEISRNPSLLNLVLSDNRYWSNYVHQKFGPNPDLPLIQLNDLIPELTDDLEVITSFDGGCLPTDLSLLKALCRKSPESRYFEIGTWRGESVANVSNIAAECLTLDLTEEEMIRKKFSDSHRNRIGALPEGIAHLTHLKGDSMKIDFAVLNQQFDVIFIDGDHRYHYVKNDTKNVFRHLVHDRSIVVWHDYFYSPGLLRFEVLAGILDGVPEQYKQYLYCVSSSKCAIFIREPILSREPHPAAMYEETFRVTLKYNKAPIPHTVKQ